MGATVASSSTDTHSTVRDSCQSVAKPHRPFGTAQNVSYEPRLDQGSVEASDHYDSSDAFGNEMSGDDPESVTDDSVTGDIGDITNESEGELPKFTTLTHLTIAWQTTLDLQIMHGRNSPQRSPS
jgi:hypothetical protein